MATSYATILSTGILVLSFTACSGGGGSSAPQPAPAAPVAAAPAPQTPSTPLTITVAPQTPSTPLTITVAPMLGDATAALQQALAQARQAGGAQVLLQAGVFQVSSTSRIPSNTILSGAGEQATLILMAPGMTGPAFVNDAYRSTTPPDVNITLRGFTVYGGRATPPGAFSAYADIWNPGLTFHAHQYMINTRDVLKIYQARTDCQTATTGSGPAEAANGIADGTCVWDYIEPLWTPATDAIILSRLDGGLIEDITIAQTRNDGLILELCTNITVRGSTFRDVNKNGIYLSNVEHLDIYKNLFHNNYADIGAANTWYTALHDNRGTDTVNYFIGVGRDTEYTTITQNIGGRFLTNNESITGTAHGKTYPDPYDAYRYGMYESTVADNVFTMLQLINSRHNLIQENIIGPVGPELGGYGLWLLGAQDNTILDNKIIDGTSWAVVSQMLTSSGTQEGMIASSGNVYMDNTVQDECPGGAMLGVYIDAFSTQTVLQGNSVNLCADKPLATQHYTLSVR